MGKAADQYLEIDPWKIVEQGFHADKSKVSESLFSLCNEHMGVRGYFDEGYTGSSLTGSYLNGIYEEHFLKEPMAYKGISNRICFMVNTANWLYTRIELDGELLDLNTSRFSGFRRELDFKTGLLRREFTWKTRAGQELKIVFLRMLSMQIKELGYQRILLTPLNFSGPISVTLGIDFSPLHEMYAQNFWDCPKKGVDEDTCAILGASQSIGHKLFAGFKASGAGIREHQAVIDEKFAGIRFTMNLVQGQEQGIDRAVVLYTTRDPHTGVEDAWSQGTELLRQAGNTGFTEVTKANSAYWEDFWEHADIQIDGDPEAQQGIRFCIFQLQQTYRGAVAGTNIGAKGMTGEAYNGNAFWDTETYCLPYYIFSNPQAAKALIDFRYRTLPQAMERAKALDCQGACYPVATTDGTESCTLWQHASLQFQATTGVAYAIWHYAKITQDEVFLYSCGIEMLIQICRFLASRGQWSLRRKQFGFYAVMGPDEFQMMVNHNCYTNFMARQTFLFTLRALADMETQCPQRKAAILSRLSCRSEDLAAWQKIADNMLIPYDPARGIYEQHEGFFDLPHIDADTIPQEDFPLYYHWSYDRIYRNDLIKQPDVLMFMFLYNQSFSLAEKQANYEYYEPLCIHESSLSPSLHSIFAAELGRRQEAFEFFKFATRIDLDNYNRNTADGIHITSIAAAWMNVVYGYGGMRSDGEELVFNPTIPPHWKSYRFQVTYRGSIIRVQVTQAQACIQVVDGGPVTAVIGGELLEITREGLLVNVTGEGPILEKA